MVVVVVVGGGGGGGIGKRLALGAQYGKTAALSLFFLFTPLLVQPVLPLDLDAQGLPINFLLKHGQSWEMRSVGKHNSSYSRLENVMRKVVPWNMVASYLKPLKIFSPVRMINQKKVWVPKCTLMHLSNMVLIITIMLMIGDVLLFIRTAQRC